MIDPKAPDDIETPRRQIARRISVAASAAEACA